MLTQAQLERKVEVFTTNGKKPEAQVVISKVGYAPAKLDEHAALLAAIRLGHSSCARCVEGAETGHRGRSRRP